MALKDEFIARFGERPVSIPETRANVIIPPDAVRSGEVTDRPYTPEKVVYEDRPHAGAVFPALPLNAYTQYVTVETVIGAYAGAVEIVTFQVPTGFAGIPRSISMVNSSNAVPYFSVPPGNLEVTALSTPNVAGVKLTCSADGSGIRGLVDIPASVTSVTDIYAVLNERAVFAVSLDLLAVADTTAMQNRTILTTVRIDMVPIVEADYRFAVVRG